MIETTYYIRDAQGNVMATYLNKNEGSAETYHLTERPIYGSSRLGMLREKVNMLAEMPAASAIRTMRYGLKHYELTNHLGNVTTTLTAQKVPFYENSVLTYKPQIVQSMDYSPFGVTRLSYDVTPVDINNPVDEGYRYGFNGQEKDDEIAGSGNSYTAMFWQYDSRLGRRWNVDPMTYPWQSSYATFNNNGILYTDPLGLYGTKKEAREQRRLAKKSGHNVGDIYSVGKGKNRDFGFGVSSDTEHFQSFNNKTWGSESSGGSTAGAQTPSGGSGNRGGWTFDFQPTLALDASAGARFDVPGKPIGFNLNGGTRTVVGFKNGDWYLGGRNYGSILTSSDNSNVEETTTGLSASALGFGFGYENTSAGLNGELMKSAWTATMFGFFELSEESKLGQFSLTNPPTPYLREFSINIPVAIGIGLIPNAGARFVLYSDTLR